MHSQSFFFFTKQCDTYAHLNYENCSDEHLSKMFCDLKLFEIPYFKQVLKTTRNLCQTRSPNRQQRSFAKATCNHDFWQLFMAIFVMLKLYVYPVNANNENKECIGKKHYMYSSTFYLFNIKNVDLPFSIDRT